jgi:hypothetical protein
MQETTWEGAKGLEVSIHCPTAVYQQYPGKMFEGDSVNVCIHPHECHKRAIGLFTSENKKHIGYLPKEVADILYTRLKSGKITISAVSEGRVVVKLNITFGSASVLKKKNWIENLLQYDLNS